MDVAQYAATIRAAALSLSDDALVAFATSFGSDSAAEKHEVPFLSDNVENPTANSPNNSLAFLNLPIQGAIATRCPRYHDSRGFFQETFHVSKYEEALWPQCGTSSSPNGTASGHSSSGVPAAAAADPPATPSPAAAHSLVERRRPWLQKSWSRSRRHVLRGLHTSTYAKLVTCIRGAVYDVFVDTREGSPTFLKWVGVYLSEKNRRQIYVPAGCAHSFLTLEAVNDVIYLQEGVFNPPEERDLLWNDASVAIPWDAIVRRFCPRLTSPSELILSDKDKVCQTLLQRSPHLKAHIQKATGRSSGGKGNGRVLVVGGSGQVGSAMLEEFSAHGWQALGTFFSADNGSNAGMAYFDLSQAAAPGRDAVEACNELMELCMPTAVVICAGWTWVDGCERDEARAVSLNAAAPAQLAAAARRVGARTVFLSTEYLFAGGVGGTAIGPYTESSPPIPINAYGRSKLKGEAMVAAADPNSLLLRTTVVYGPDPRGKNFVYQLARKLGKDGSVCATEAEGMRVVSDQISSPTYSRDLARATRLLLLAKGDEGQPLNGVFNVVGPDSIDRYTFAAQAAEVLGLDTSKLSPITTAALGQTAPRPLAAGLEASKLRSAIGWAPRAARDALQHWLENPRIGIVSTGTALATGGAAMPLFGSANNDNAMKR